MSIWDWVAAVYGTVLILVFVLSVRTDEDEGVLTVAISTIGLLLGYLAGKF